MVELVLVEDVPDVRGKRVDVVAEILFQVNDVTVQGGQVMAGADVEAVVMACPVAQHTRRGCLIRVKALNCG